jgi:hypothetical protein
MAIGMNQSIGNSAGVVVSYYHTSKWVKILTLSGRPNFPYHEER